MLDDVWLVDAFPATQVRNSARILLSDATDCAAARCRGCLAYTSTVDVAHEDNTIVLQSPSSSLSRLRASIEGHNPDLGITAGHVIAGGEVPEGEFSTEENGSSKLWMVLHMW